MEYCELLLNIAKEFSKLSSIFTIVVEIQTILNNLSPTNLTVTSGLYYKPITIVNDDSSVINKLETSLIDDAIGIIYDRHIFIVQKSK